VGFRNFYYYKLLRKRNIGNIRNKINLFSNKKLDSEKMAEIFQGWNAYAKWADCFNLRIKIMKEISNLI